MFVTVSPKIYRWVLTELKVVFDVTNVRPA